MPKKDQKVVLITGASSGIGAALAREFATRGDKLLLLARRSERLQQLAQEMDASGSRVAVMDCDVNADGELERAVALALQRFGRLDIAVANAGFGVAGRFEQLTLADYRSQLETNVFGVLRTAYASLAALKASQGTLVVMGSVAGHVCMAGASAYGMSKFAVRGWAESMRAELHADGITVTLISPGFVSSEIRKVDNRGALHADARDPIPEWLRMPADVAARQMVRGILRGKRELIVTGHGKAAVLLKRLSPGLIAWVGRRGLRGRTQPKS
jgi:short-subunit dehydrogenase